MNRLAVAVALGLAIAASARAEVSIDDAAALAQRYTAGRVLSIARPQGEQAPAEWRVKVLSTGGEVRVIGIDSSTGRVAAPSNAPMPSACADTRSCRRAKPPAN